jgi:hypothetical protein
MSLAALAITNTPVNLQPQGSNVLNAVGGQSGASGNVARSLPASALVTSPIASPGVFTGVYLPNTTQVVLSGTTAPGGFTFGTTYYVVNASQANQTFQLSATSGGSAINISSAGAGVIATAQSSTEVLSVVASPSMRFSPGNTVLLVNPSNASLTLQDSDDQSTYYGLATVPPFTIVELLLRRQYVRVSTSATMYLMTK